MLLRDGRPGPEVLMVKRAARGPFPNLYVFPGGKVDESEQVDGLRAHCKGLDDATASYRLGLSDGGLKYWVACARECFEETGVLLARSGDGSPIGPDLAQMERLRQYRQRLNAGESQLMTDLCVGEDLHLHLGDIAYSAHWITPKIEKKRFNTRFFVAAMPGDQEPVHDGQEVVDSLWIRPEDALKAGEAGTMGLIMPTIENLKSLLGFSSAAEAVQARAAVQEIPAILPKFVKIDGVWTGLLPEDPRYEDYD